MSIVETEALSKQYGDVAALRDCTLHVKKGEVFGLLGPNGAGKTTLLRLLMGFLHPTGGWAKINGLDCTRQSVKVRESVSYLPGEARLFRHMRGRDVLRFFAGVRPTGNLERAVHLAKRLDLELSRRVAFMSTGMRQKLALAVALSVETPLVILDEPTSNLDPTVRRTVSQLVLEAKKAGRTIIFSSHVLSEVEEVCDQVVILRAGQPVHGQVMSELRKRHRIYADLDGPLPPTPEHFAEQLTVSTNGDGQVQMETTGELSPLLGWLATLQLRQVRIEPVGLRAVYDQFHGEDVDKQP